MSRRKQSDPSEMPNKRWKSEDKVVQDNDAEIEWSEEEKNRLLEALKKDAGKNNWRSIARQVRTKDITQVKLFASKHMAEKQQGASCLRPIAPKENNPLEAWISVTEKLKGDDDVDGTCIPQKREEDCGSRLQDGLLTLQTENTVHVSDGTQKRKKEAQLTVDQITNLQSFKESQASVLQDLISRMDDLLDHQNQLEGKVSQLDSKVEALCMDRLSESSCQDMLQMLREQIDQLSKTPLHRCLGGSVIIHAPPHAHVVHQPHMESCGTCMTNTVHRKEKKSRDSNVVLPSITTCGNENISRQSQGYIADVPEIEMSEANCTCVHHRLGDKNFATGKKMPVRKTGAGSSEEVEAKGCAQRGMPASSNGHHRFAILEARTRQNSVANVSNNLHSNAYNLSYRVPPSRNAVKDVSIVGIAHGTSSEKDQSISVGDGCLDCVANNPIPLSSAATLSANLHAKDTVIFTQRTGLLVPSVTADKTTSNTTITPLQKDLPHGLHPTYMVPAKSVVPPPESSRTAISKCLNCKLNATTPTAGCSSCLSQSTAQEKRSVDCVKFASSSFSNEISREPDSSPANVTSQKASLVCPLTSVPKVVSQDTQPNSATPGLTVSLNHAEVVQNMDDIQQNKEPPFLAGSATNVDLVSRKSDAPFSCNPASVSPIKTYVSATKEMSHESLQLLGTSSPSEVQCLSPRTFAVTLTSRALPSTGTVELSDARHKVTSNQPPAPPPRMVILPSSAVNVIRSAHSDVSGGAAHEKHDDKTLLCNNVISQQGLSFETSPSVGLKSESSYSQQDVLKAAVVISKFVSEQQSQQNQATWRSCLTGIANLYQKNNCNKDTETNTIIRPQVEKNPQTVFIGCNPDLVLTRCELEEILERSRGRPNFFAIRLAEQLYGEDVLVKSTPNGIGGKAALKPSILEAIKVEVLNRFAQDKSDFEKKELWKQCLTSIAQRCKRARHMSKKNTCDKTQGEMSVDEPACHPVIVTDVERLDDEYLGRDKSVATTDRNSRELSNEAQLLSSNAAPFQPDKTSLGEEEEQEEEEEQVECIASSNSSIPMVDYNVDGSESSPREIQSSMELSSKTNKGMSAGNKHELPPGVDPDITVVHLPVSIQSPALKSQVRSPNTELSSLEESVGHVCDEHDHDLTGQEKSAQISERSSQAQETDSTDDLTEKDKFYGECLQVLGSIYNPSAQESTVTVSGIQMTRDFSQVIIGGNPKVVVPRQKYLDALERSSQPTHFAVRLAELTFGDDVLKASTVTGAKRGTKHLDATVLDAIQSELVERFMKDESHEVQSIIWRKCLASIATRSVMFNILSLALSTFPFIKELVKNLSLLGYFPFGDAFEGVQSVPLQTKHPRYSPEVKTKRPFVILIMTIAAKEPTDAASRPGCVTPDYSQIYTLLSRVMRGQPPPDLSPLDASIILDLLNDVESKLPILDVSNQVNFVINKYKEATANYQPVTSSGRQLRPRHAKRVATTGEGQIRHTTSERPRTKLFSLNPLNIPVQLLNMKKKSQVPANQSR